MSLIASQKWGGGTALGGGTPKRPIRYDSSVFLFLEGGIV